MTQLKTFSILQNMLDDIEIYNKKIIFGGDFNLILDCKLETNGGNLVLRNKWKSEPMWYLEKTKPTKKSYISSESGFWFRSKKTRLFFRLEQTSRFCQKNKWCFCIFLHWPVTNFFLIWKWKWFCLCKRIIEVFNLR